jgi:asparagine synthase (glutamine-hydrolysing)
MCGFAGIFSPSRPLITSEIALAERVCARQRHRGPDSSGSWIGGNIALFHNKLSITTTNGESDQPFQGSGVRCVFSGEIYNHRELAAHLGDGGSDFDGRVIPIGFARSGATFLGAMDGEFAVALADTASGTVTLARDRAGSRNLYFTKTPGGCWVFSTELASLAIEPEIPCDLDANALVDQLVLHEWTPRMGTFFTGIVQVAPGTGLVLSRDVPSVHAYHAAPGLAYDRADVLRRATVARIRHSQQSRGCLAFSGGMDSTALAAISETLPDGWTTLTVVREANDAIANRVRRIARNLPKLRPDMVVLRDEEINTRALTELTSQLASPVCDTTPFALSALFSEAHRRGLRYCISGEGADDFWGGYASEVPFLRTDSVQSAYVSLVERVRENGFAELLGGELRKVPLLGDQATDLVIHRLANAHDALLSAAEDQSPLVVGRPLAVLSVLGPLRRSLEQVDCLAGNHSMEARIPFCASELLSRRWEPEWADGKAWIVGSLDERVRERLDWTKESFATRRFEDTGLADDVGALVEEILSNPVIGPLLRPGIDVSMLKMLAAANSKLWWSMVGIARFYSVFCRS